MLIHIYYKSTTKEETGLHFAVAQNLFINKRWIKQIFNCNNNIYNTCKKKTICTYLLLHFLMSAIVHRTHVWLVLAKSFISKNNN